MGLVVQAALLVGFPALAIAGARKSRVVRFLDPVVGCYLAGFGVANAVVTPDGPAAGPLYPTGFEAAPAGTFTDASGHFVIANVAPGNVTVKAYGRRASGGGLELLSSIKLGVAADEITAIGLQPR